MPKQHKLRDDSADHKYFIVTPQLVWALCRDPYDYILWNVVKMIAGDDEECFLCTDDLATLAMMSTGKVSQCRTYLIEIGLLDGEIRKDPGWPQPVWHLRIPDLWPANIKWRRDLGDALKVRIEMKRQQRESLHQVKPSPGEEGPSPGEEGPSPGETKENQKENTEGEQAAQDHFYITERGIKVHY